MCAGIYFFCAERTFPGLEDFDDRKKRELAKGQDHGDKRTAKQNP